MEIGKISIIIIITLISCKSDPATQNHKDTFSTDKLDIKAYNLISPEVAHEWIIEKPEVYIPIQVSKEKNFNSEHIPKAQNIWRPDYGSDTSKPYGGLIPSKEKLEHLLQILGYEEGKTLLLYDIKANVDAMRFAWVLNLYGFDNFKIINGGLSYWKKQDLPTTNEKAPIIAKSNYQLEDNFDHSIIANFEEVLAAIQDTNTLLLDTRENYEYLGQAFVDKSEVLPCKKGAFNRGSIPSAIHLNWSSLVDLNGDHRIKSEKDLRYNLAQKGITSDKKIILYCQSGSRTCHTFYVLKHVLAYQNVKNYDGSWIEWSYKNSIDNEIPIEQLTTDIGFKILQDSLIKSLN